MSQGIGPTLIQSTLAQSTFGSQVVLGSDTFYSTNSQDSDAATPRYVLPNCYAVWFTAYHVPSLFLDTLFVPVYASGISVLAAVIHFLIAYSRTRSTLHKNSVLTGGDVPHTNELFSEASVSHVQKHGGLAIFLYRIARLLTCVALVGFSISPLVHNGQPEHLSHSVALHLALCGVYVRLCPFSILDSGLMSFKHRFTQRSWLSCQLQADLLLLDLLSHIYVFSY